MHGGAHFETTHGTSIEVSHSTTARSHATRTRRSGRLLLNAGIERRLRLERAGKRDRSGTTSDHQLARQVHTSTHARRTQSISISDFLTNHVAGEKLEYQPTDSDVRYWLTTDDPVAVVQTYADSLHRHAIRLGWLFDDQRRPAEANHILSEALLTILYVAACGLDLIGCIGARIGCGIAVLEGVTGVMVATALCVGGNNDDQTRHGIARWQAPTESN